MKRKVSPSRIIIVSLIVACVLYFIIGGIIAWRGWISPNNYVVIGGIVGGIASVLSLVSFARPSVSQEDINNLEIQALQRLANATVEIQRLEAARTVTQEQIGSLEQQRLQMEFLVRKASLSLFLGEQLKRHEERILEEVSKNKELEQRISDYHLVRERVIALDGEILSDPNVELLRTIIKDLQDDDPIFRGLDKYGSIVKPFVIMARLFVDFATFRMTK